MNQSILIVEIALLILLILVFARVGFGFLSDTLQRHNTIKNQLVAENTARIELAGRLRQTYVDLSMSRRQTRWREVMVVKVVQESEDVRSFYLVDRGQDPLPSGLPGQHILVERARGANSSGVCRCYSLSDDCSAGHWRISVKKNSSNAESVSRWLHEEVAAGDVLRVRGPSGAFHLQTSVDRKIVLVSAGIGITPILPMLFEAIRKPCRSVLCFAQFRDVAHMPFIDTLSSIAAHYAQVEMEIWISRFPKGVRRSAESLFREGKFQAKEMLSHEGVQHNSEYYICGPEEWQERICADLVDAGVRPDFIHHELFQQSEKPALATPSSKFASHHIHFKQSGSIAKFESIHNSLLACAGQNSVSLESGCRTGACGSCAVRLLGGKVRYTREPQFQTQTNEILPCVCVPESDLEVDA
ncbi:MAG: FAD-binding oxidoreductase [Planctomycetota bacterium]|nr:FAD-binding oxidoreductase [Planctomycetota bacterium]